MDVDEKTFLLIKSYGKKDVGAIVNDALSKWASENILKCPLDGNFCASNGPCNGCAKLNNEKK